MLENYKNLVFGISEKADGAMKFLNDETGNQTTNNRINFFRKRNIGYKSVVAVVSGHSNKVKIVNKKDRGKIIKRHDALITAEKDVLLAITIADCIPIYFYALKPGIVGLAHAGWQEIKLGVASWTVRKLKEKFNIKPSEIEAYLGPHIRSCHFEVKKDVALAFKEHKKAVIKRNNKLFISLSGIIKEQLIKSGLKLDNIKISQECTYCLKDKYFSYRRDKPKKIKTMIAYIGMKR